MKLHVADCPMTNTDAASRTGCICGRDQWEGTDQRYVEGGGGERAPEDACSVAGHDFAPAGGGLLVCLRCESEKWADGVTAAGELTTSRSSGAST